MLDFNDSEILPASMLDLPRYGLVRNVDPSPLGFVWVPGNNLLRMQARGLPPSSRFFIAAPGWEELTHPCSRSWVIDDYTISSGRF